MKKEPASMASAPVRGFAFATLVRAGWAPLLVFTIHVVLSATDLYNDWHHMDTVMHVLGGVAIAHFSSRAYREAEARDLLGRPAPVLHAFSVLGATSLAATFWEFAEYYTTNYLGSLAQLTIADTLLDMALGLVGALGYLAVLARSSTPEPPMRSRCAP